MSINNYPNTEQCENGPKHSNDTAPNESHVMGEEEVNSKPSENMILNDIKQNKDYQIIFTGHSLGGAIATLASYYFKKYILK